MADSSALRSEREIFLEALEIQDSAKREEYLRIACKGNASLRRGVERLLEEEAAQTGLLGHAAFKRDSAAPAQPNAGPGGTHKMADVTEANGTRIGRYKLLQRIGEGGCGFVYMAEQEEPIRRRVALKIIKLGMDTRQVIARFEAERQALAMMDHPHIAKVLDAGATETGRPFFVMELVRGIKITEYCDQNNLPMKERLELFVQVCNAIQHAHQKGIIHRDIKPSNIMVTLHDGTAVPKVIDFGVAKATNQQRLTDKTVFTAFEQFIGTPAYMSPEQAEMSGLDVDTRSDIYSLGVLLYELTTGKTPFDADQLMRAGLDECRRTLRQDEPARPSNRLATMVEADLTSAAMRRRTEVPRLIHQLRGDLDWVVMKCLEKDRTRRYATVNALAVDVQRYLQGEPVVARPPSGYYRFRKFARRHRGALSAAAAILATILAGTGISIWQAIRATHAEREAYVSQHAESFLRREAENGWNRAREQTLLARQNEYIADVSLAQQSLIAGNYGRAVQLLEKHLPAVGFPDLRGFEWRYLWQLSHGDDHISLPDQDSMVLSVAFSPNNELLAAGLFEKLNVYDIHTRKLVASLPKGVLSMAFSPDGKWLYTASQASVRVWNAADWSELRVIDDGEAPIALSSDGSRLAVCDRRGVRLWDTSSWEPIRFLRGAGGPVAFSSHGGLLATDTRDGITIWNTDSGEPGIVLQNSTNLFRGPGPKFRGDRAIAFSPDDRLLVAPRNQQSTNGVFVVGIWDLATGRELGVMPEDPEHIEHTGSIASLAFAADGTLVTGSLDHSIRIWDLATHKVKAVLQGNLNEVWSVAVSADGRLLASGAKGGGLKLWPVGGHQKNDLVKGGHIPLAFSRDSRTLVTLKEDSSVVFINLATREPQREIALTPGSRGPRPPGSVSLSSDLTVVAEGLQDGSVKLWNSDTRESTHFQASDRGLGLVLLSPDGNELVTGGFWQPLKLWDLRTGQATLLGTQAHRALFSPDGKTLAVLGREDSIGFWDVSTRALKTNVVMDPSPGFAAAFSPDSRLFAVSAGFKSAEDTVRLWDVQRTRLLGSFTGHKQAIFSLAFSPDGKTLVSASDDSTLKMWNVATRQEMVSVRRLGGSLQNLMFSPDGRWLVGARGAFPGSEETELVLHFAPTFPEIEVELAQAP